MKDLKDVNPMVSVIIPVYNGQDTIRDVVESICNQSYKDWELILIDDGSKDSSGELCDQLAESDNRISVIHQKNKGLSGARNTGIKAANGTFIAFIDADDIVLDGYLESMLSPINNCNEIDLVCCGYAVIGAGETNINTYYTKQYIGEHEISILLGETDFLKRSCVWGRLFRRKTLLDNQLFFDEKLLNAEDRPFLYYYLDHTRGIATTSYVGYIYGSYSPNSNKNRYYPLNVLEYRQIGQTQATKEFINHFSLSGDNAFYPIHHLMYIMLSTIQSIYYEYGYSKKTVEQQKNFVNRFLDGTLKKQLINCPRWQSFLQNEKLMKNMLSEQYWKLNRCLLYNKANQKIKLMVHNMLKKSKKQFFSLKKSISMINNS